MGNAMEIVVVSCNLQLGFKVACVIPIIHFRCEELSWKLPSYFLIFVLESASL